MAEWTYSLPMFILLCLGTFWVSMAGEQTDFIKLDGRYSREMAEVMCKQREADLILPADDELPEIRRKLLGQFTENGQRFWLAPKRHVLPKLTDSNGRQFTGTSVLTNPRDADKNCFCAMLYPRGDETLVERFSCTAACHNRSDICVRAICQSRVRGRQGNCTCGGASAADTDCIQFNGTCLHIARHPTTWYGARAQCQRQGMTLVQVRADEDVKQLSARINEHQKEKGGSENGIFFWLDLNQERWLYTRDNDTFEVTQNYWAHQSKTAKGNCVTLTYIQGRVLWEVTDCAEHHQVVCQRRIRPTELTTVGPGMDTGQASTGSATPEKRNDNITSDLQTGHQAAQKGVNVPAIAAPIVLLLLAVGCGVVIYIFKKDLRRICDRQPDSERNGSTQEGTEMINRNPDVNRNQDDVC